MHRNTKVIKAKIMINLRERLHKLIICFAFGIATGIPWVLIVSTLNAWLAEVGINKATIGLLSSLVFPYALKFLWAPAIDQFSIPILSRLIGHKKAWLLTIQPLLALAIIILGCTDPIENIYQTAICALLVSFLAATQEIIINYYRITILSQSEQGTGASVQTFGLKVGSVICSGFLLFIIDYLCKNQNLCKDFINWRIGFTAVGFAIILTSIPVLFLKEPLKEASRKSHKNYKTWAKANFEIIKAIFISPLGDFRQKKHYLLILFFIISYRLCDYSIASMINPFLIELGFSLTEIGLIVKSFGFLASLLGTILSGILSYYLSIYRALLIAGVLAMSANAMFIIQAKVGYNLEVLYFTIGLGRVFGSLASTILVIYMSGLCRSSKYPATQYSLFSSVSNASRVLLPIIAGATASLVNWVTFFGISIILGIPSLILILVIQYKEQKQKTKNQQNNENNLKNNLKDNLKDGPLISYIKAP